jgi:putative membrane protein
MALMTKTRLLSEEDQRAVSEAIAAVERNTDAELVTVLARQADTYHYIPALWAAAIALLVPGAFAMTPLWLSLWDVLLLQWLVFVVLVCVLRIPAVMFRLIPQSIRVWRAGNLARRQFLEQNLHHTRHQTGVLIFVAEAEHYVEIIADRGIDQYVDTSEWRAIVDEFTYSVRRGDTRDGFLRCIERCGALLHTHVPATDQKNELPNHLVLIE